MSACLPTVRRAWIAVLGLGVLLAATSAVRASDEQPVPGPFHNIWVIDFEGPIEGLLHTYVKRRVEAAQAADADCIVLRITSPGGTIFHSMLIGDLMLAVPKSIHTVAWVPRYAYSGAAMVSVCCREIILSPHAPLGDSQPITVNPDGTPKPVGEKAESPLRTWIRDAAERNGYPALLAAAMVSERLAVLRVRAKATGEIHYVATADFRDAEPDARLLGDLRKSDLEQMGAEVVRVGELLTFTGNEAAALGFMPRFASGPPPSDEGVVLDLLKAPDAKITVTEMSFSELATRFLLGLVGILSGLVTMAIVYTVWRGPGIVTIGGAIALLLVIFISVTADHFHGFPIFLMLVGVALLIAEVFFFPGFTIPGFLGIGFLASGVLFLATGIAPSEVGEVDSRILVNFGLQFVFTAIAAFAAIFLMSRLVPRFGPGRAMILTAPGGEASTSAAAEPSVALPPVGATGVATSPLRPAGTAEFADALFDVVSTGGFIEQGAAVRVLEREGERITVDEVSS